METKELKVKLTFTEPLLGTSASNADIYRDFIASKAPTLDTGDEEIETVRLSVDETVEKGMTIFPRNEDGKPFLYDYQIKGFFKDTAGGLRKVKGTKSEAVKAYKKEIDKLIFPEPRQIVIQGDYEVGTCQRPLRAQTMQGERVSLAISEEIPAGSFIEFTIVLLDAKHEAWVREMLDYGKYSGIGQWRNSGRGRFVWEEI